jgi:hypothetical protein
MDSKENVFDPLDMSQYKIDKLPKREKNKTEKFLTLLGPPLAVVAFVLLGFIPCQPTFLHNFDPEKLTSGAKEVFDRVEVMYFTETIVICWPFSLPVLFYGSLGLFQIILLLS